MSPARGRLSSGKELDPGGARPRADEAFTNHSHGKRQDVSGVQMSKNEKRGKKKKKDNQSEILCSIWGDIWGSAVSCQYEM